MTDSSKSSRPLAILTLDGGGVQAISTLLILNRVLERIAEESGHPKDRKPRPCDVFDTIAGIGAGGWLAILLGRFRMDITTCLSEWYHLMQRIGPRSLTEALRLRLLHHRYLDTTSLVQQVDSRIQVYGTGDYLFECDPQGARTRHVFVAALTADGGGYNLFRSYEIPTSAKLPQKLLEGPENPDSFKISHAFAVTGAARYFTAPWKEQMASSGKTKFYDTKFPEPHNITGLALNEMYGIYGTDVPLSVVVNIGPGLPNDADVQDITRRLPQTNSRGIGTSLTKLQDDIDNDIKKMLDDVHPGNADLYHRLAPGIAPPGTPQDDSRASDVILDAILRYLDEPCVNATINSLVKRMVKSDSSC